MKRVVSLRCALSLAVVVAVVGGGSTTASASTPVEAGYRSFSFGQTPSAPTAKDPQSKVWFHDGSWWGTLWHSAAKRHEIYRLDWATQVWVATGTVVDERSAARADMLSVGARLYGVTAGTSESTTSHAPRVHAFSYDAATHRYSRDFAPVTVGGGGTSAASIARDTTGRLWIAFAQGSAIRVSHSASSESAWVAPFVLPGATGMTAEDEPAMVAFDGRIGVMWSNQNTWTYHFAVHRDGASSQSWETEIAHQAYKEADNHINLKALENDPAGKVFAVVKTELTSKGLPLHYVLVLGNDGTWRKHQFGTTDDNHTRAQLVLDPENRRLYVLATTPCCSGGAIYYKETSLDSIAFAPGLGTPLIKSSSDTTINNVSTTKQPLTSASGLVAVAGDDRTDYYLHAALQPQPAPPPPSTVTVSIDSGPSGSVSSTSATFVFSSPTATATFQCKLDGGSFAACASPRAYSGLSEGTHTFAVRALSGQSVSTAAERTWVVDTVAPGTTIDAAPPVQTAETSATFHFSSDDAAARFACSLDGAAFASCDSPLAFDLLTQGSHVFEVRAVDAAGNVDETPARHEWIVGSFGSFLFEDGFESGSLSAWTTVQASPDGTASVSGATVKTGAFAARLAATSTSGSFAYARKTLPHAVSDVTIAGHVLISVEGASGGNVPIFRAFDSGGARIVSLYRQNQDGNKVRIGHSGIGATTSGRLALGTWAFFELRLTAGAGAGSIAVRMNGTTIYETTSANLGTGSIVAFQIGNETRAQTFAIAVDDVTAR